MLSECVILELVPALKPPTVLHYTSSPVLSCNLDVSCVQFQSFVRCPGQGKGFFSCILCFHCLILICVPVRTSGFPRDHSFSPVRAVGCVLSSNLCFSLRIRATGSFSHFALIPCLPTSQEYISCTFVCGVVVIF